MQRRAAIWSSRPAWRIGRTARSRLCSIEPRPRWVDASCAAGCIDRCAIAGRSSCACRRIGTLIDKGLHGPLHDLLAHVGDVERGLARVALKTARPRDLAQLREALARLPDLQRLLAGLDSPALLDLATRAGTYPDIHALLVRAIVEQPPPILREGGVIAIGYDAELDELQRISEHSDQYLLDLEARERERSGIANLRLGYNRVQGYYIEINRSLADRVPPDYHRRQTVKNAERYITPELKEFEDKVLSARDRALAREKQLYDELLDQLIGRLAELQATAAALAALDVLANLAERAVTLRYTAPQLTDEPVVEISEGRHPVVEQFIDQPFVPNDLQLHDARRILVDHRPEHGRQIDLHAADRADRDPRAHGQLRAGARGAHRADRPRVHAHRRVRRSRGRPFDVHAGDDRGREHPEQRHGAEPGVDGRDRARHEHLRRTVARVGLRAASGPQHARVHVVRNALLRIDVARRASSKAAQTCTSTRPSTATSSSSCTR